MIYAGLIVAAISMGLLRGLATLGVSLPVDPPGRAVPMWHDVIAAGLAAASYSVFFSIPPIYAGMAGGGRHAAHAIRWVTLTALGVGSPIGAL